MKSAFTQGLAALVAATVLTASAAFAGQKPESAEVKGPVAVKFDAAVGAQTIAEGKYDAVVSGDAEPVLTIRRGKTEFVRVRVERQSLPTASPYDQVQYSKNTDGTRSIVSITFKGATETYVVRGTDQVAKANE